MNRSIPILIIGGLLPWLATFPTYAQPSEADAHTVFRLAAGLAERDTAHLWNIRLEAPIILADPDSRQAWATDSVTGFRPNDRDLWSGILPDAVGIANTASRLEDKTFVILRWPAPSEPTALRRLLAHELWHGVQDSLGFPSAGPGNEHLGGRDGRYFIRLEMRALTAALRAPGNTEPIRHALHYRSERLTRFPAASTEETALMMHEGLAEYTGLALSGLSPAAAAEHAAADLARAESAPNLSRSFAYALGPAYGLLLDIHRPGWRDLATPNVHLAELLPFSPAAPPPLAYDETAIAEQEDLRESQRLADLEQKLFRFTLGPRLHLPFQRMNVTFDPGQVEILEGHGSIYPALRITDVWGVLEVSDGALILSDWSGVVVPLSDSETAHTLELAEGWRLEPGEEAGVQTVRRH